MGDFDCILTGKISNTCWPFENEKDLTHITHMISDTITHSTKSIWFLKAPVKRTNLQLYIWWFVSTMCKIIYEVFEGYFVTPWVILASLNSKIIHQSKEKLIICVSYIYTYNSSLTSFSTPFWWINLYVM